MGKLIAVLKQLDPDNNDHWTTEGVPRLDVIKNLNGGIAVGRTELREVAPGFTRQNLVFPEIRAPQNAKPTKTGPVPAQQATAGPGPVPEQGQQANAASARDKAVEDELEASRKNLADAQRRYSKATTAMDAVVMRRSTEGNHLNHAETVKAFQRSQAAQRTKAVTMW